MLLVGMQRVNVRKLGIDDDVDLVAEQVRLAILRDIEKRRAGNRAQTLEMRDDFRRLARVFQREKDRCGGS